MIAQRHHEDGKTIISNRIANNQCPICGSQKLEEMEVVTDAIFGEILVCSVHVKSFQEIKEIKKDGV